MTDKPTIPDEIVTSVPSQGELEAALNLGTVLNGEWNETRETLLRLGGIIAQHTRADGKTAQEWKEAVTEKGLSAREWHSKWVNESQNNAVNLHRAEAAEAKLVEANAALKRCKWTAQVADNEKERANNLQTANAGLFESVQSLEADLTTSQRLLQEAQEQLARREESLRLADRRLSAMSMTWGLNEGGEGYNDHEKVEKADAEYWETGKLYDLDLISRQSPAKGEEKQL